MKLNSACFFNFLTSHLVFRVCLRLSALPLLIHSCLSACGPKKILNIRKIFVTVTIGHCLKYTYRTSNVPTELMELGTLPSS